ncbi:putative nuclease HARBI1, partial [Myzus persicae]|uniref:putative nuclease HARBI1 n=1 Tax=Myzus persicae TaxID=13164 RepID=UPI000B934282
MKAQWRAMSLKEMDNICAIDLKIDLEDEKDVSWGGKRTRYIYNYTFESSDSKTDDSDATESVHMEAASEADLSSDRSFGSNCDSNGQTNHTEFDVVSTSSSCHDIQSSSSDSSTLIDFKATLERIIQELTPFLKINRRSDGISVESKISSAVRFLAQGAYQRGVGKETNIGLSQPSVSRVLNEVIDCINLHLLQKYIKFPTSPAEKQKIKDWFRTRFHIPGVIGVIDGSHIGIFPPSTNHNQYPEFVYVNRKGFHSINTQLIVDHTYRILNVNAKFPGSTHDSHIWKMSLIRNHLSNTYRRDHEWLLGDSGYPLEPWLLTPFSNPGDGSPESRFNVKFTSARSVVERAIGMLKGRWRCLCKQRMLHYKPTIASKIINACAVLHNICIENFDAAYEDEEYDELYNANDLIHFPAGNALHTE